MVLITLRFFYLLLFISIASQGIFYFLTVSNAFQLISLKEFITVRKVIESLIEVPIKLLYYTAVALAISILLLQIKEFQPLLFLTVSISLVFLLGDIFFALTKSVPLNTLIRNYTAASDQELYENIRTQWLFYIKLRGGFAISGLLILLFGLWYDVHAIHKLK